MIDGVALFVNRPAIVSDIFHITLAIKTARILIGIQDRSRWRFLGKHDNIGLLVRSAYNTLHARLGQVHLSDNFFQPRIDFICSRNDFFTNKIPSHMHVKVELIMYWS